MIGLLFNRGSRASFNALKSPESRSIFLGTIGILAAAFGLWVFGAAVLSLLNAWIVVGLTGVLAVVVYVRGRRVRRRQEWIDTGFCGDCGYDLLSSGVRVCPECGRDAALDEPVWRKLRREHEAKYGRDVAAEARGAGKEVDEATVRRLLARATLSDLDR